MKRLTLAFIGMGASVFVLIAWLLFTSSSFILEFDQIEYFDAPVSVDTKTIEGIFATALNMSVTRSGETITVVPDASDIGDVALLDSAYCGKLIDERKQMGKGGTEYQEACLTEASLLSILVNSEDHRPTTGDWYAHGLSAPCCEGAVQLHTCNFEGLVWLEQVGAKRVRERFLVMECEIPDDYTPEARLDVSAHELGHVLNLHHCEYENETPLDPSTLEVKGKSGWSFTHLRSHPRSEVMPGLAGEGWCDSNTHASAMHASGSCCGVEKAASSENLPEGVTLEVHPEKLVYLPGEPIRLRAVLTIDAAGGESVERLVPGGLHPYLGYLRVWTPGGEGEVRTFYPPLVATRSLEWEGGEGPVEESEIVDLFSMHPRSGPGLLGATYTGLRLAGQDAAPLQVASATSVIQSVAPGATTGAVDPFDDEEARLFLFLLGGDHLTTGIAVMQEVAHAAGPLAPYADLALGVNLAVPFHRYDRATGSITIRHPRFEEARQHLDRAQAGRAIFPFSYAVVLDQARARAYEGLGDALRETNPASSLELYEIAKQHYEAVSTLTSASFETGSGAGHAPLSPIEKSAVALSGGRLRSLNEKIEVLMRAGEE